MGSRRSALFYYKNEDIKSRVCVRGDTDRSEESKLLVENRFRGLNFCSTVEAGGRGISNVTPSDVLILQIFYFKTRQVHAGDIYTRREPRYVYLEMYFTIYCNGFHVFCILLANLVTTQSRPLYLRL